MGNITSSNYTYYISVSNKFSYLAKRNLESGYDQLRAHYLWPTSQLDTNGAYQLATQFLRAASMDIAALNSNCVVKIDALTPEGKGGKHFVPVYWIYWLARGGQGYGPAAVVELFLPTKTIRQLRVNQSEYILRKPLQITNLDFLLSETNAPSVPVLLNSWLLRNRWRLALASLALAEVFVVFLVIRAPSGPCTTWESPCATGCSMPTP